MLNNDGTGTITKTHNGWTNPESCGEDRKFNFIVLHYQNPATIMTQEPQLADSNHY